MNHIRVGPWIGFEIQHQNDIPDDYDGPYVVHKGKVTPENFDLVESSQLEHKIKVKSHDNRARSNATSVRQLLTRAGPGAHVFAGTAFVGEVSINDQAQGQILTVAHNLVTLRADGSFKVNTDAVYRHYEDQDRTQLDLTHERTKVLATVKIGCMFVHHKYNGHCDCGYDLAIAFPVHQQLAFFEQYECQ